MSIKNNQTNLKQVRSEGWDQIAEVFSNFIATPKVGFTTLFAIDAINLSIPKENFKKAMKILDIACGTGPLSLYASDIFKNSNFIAIDFSQKMIEILDKIIKHNDIKNIETHIMDGQNLSIENDSIDYTFSIFGLIFFPDLLQGMKEMYRVLKPNNQSYTAIASWCLDSFQYVIFQETMDKLLTEQNNGKPTTYKQISLSLSNQFEFKRLLESVGFVDISITRVEHPLEVNEISDLIPLFKNNPFYLDCLDELHTDELKIKFDSLFIEIAKSKNPKRSLENNKLQLRTFSFIGVAKK
ncbi:hypothetical protein RB653_000245 [Dictyostelium firmibasis]|uniref:Methyltransferase domain-containing protein n=1 Tax=Dictyostelium firmibasis TaxID=79012 RepID=A0AAN7U6S4_9MYCE